jgi:pilus assembly protein CpaE
LEITRKVGFEMKSGLLLIESDKELRNVIRNHLNSNPFFQVDAEADDISKGYNMLMLENPDVAIIDITFNTEAVLEVINKINLSNRDCVIIVTSEDTSADLVMRAMRAGAREFISKPIDFDILDTALEKISNIRSNIKSNNVSGHKTGKVFTVFSNKGGIGKTSIAANMAVSLAEITKEKVVLVDLNIQLGDVTTFLDINPSFDIAYIANNIDRLDESFILTTLDKYKDTSLYVLADPPYIEQAEEIYAEQIITILEILKKTFSYIVIDTSANIDNKTLAALDIADTILLVSMINLPCIRNTQRCLELFDKLGYNPTKIKIIVNRYMENDEIRIEDVEETLSCSVFWKIPNNYFTLMSSINKGIPVSIINPASNLNTSYRELAASLSNTLLLEPDSNLTNAKFNLVTFLKSKLSFLNK